MRKSFTVSLDVETEYQVMLAKLPPEYLSESDSNQLRAFMGLPPIKAGAPVGNKNNPKGRGAPKKTKS